LATITSPVRLRGSSSAFEATVQVSIRQDDNSKALAEGYVMGGSLQMGPFDSTFKFAQPTSHYGAIVLYTISPEDGHVSEATVIRVRLSPT
jgi:Immunoglobulin-like domain of bacterial spore germination